MKKYVDMKFIKETVCILEVYPEKDKIYHRVGMHDMDLEFKKLERLEPCMVGVVFEKREAIILNIEEQGYADYGHGSGDYGLHLPNNIKLEDL